MDITPALQEQQEAPTLSTAAAEQLPGLPNLPQDQFTMGPSIGQQRPPPKAPSSKRTQVPNSNTASYSTNGSALVDRAYLC